MSNITLDGNPAASTLTGAEKFALIQSGSDKTTDINAINTFINTSIANSVPKPNILNLDTLPTPGTITNPLPDGTICTMTGNYSIVLPAMNVSGQSLPAGGKIYFLNLGSILRYAVYYADGSTNALTLDNPFTCAFLINNSTANGVITGFPIIDYSAFNYVRTTPYTIQQSDLCKTIVMINASANNIIIPAGLSFRFSCKIQQGGAGQTTITKGSGATVDFKDFSAATSVNLRVKDSSAVITPIDTADTYLVDGDFLG